MAMAAATGVMANSTSYTNIVGYLFGIIVAAELDTVASSMFYAHLELNHNQIVKNENYL